MGRNKAASRLRIGKGESSRGAAEEVNMAGSSSGLGLASASAVADVSVKAAPAVADVSGVGNDPQSAVELLKKRVRNVQKKIRDADSIAAKEAAGNPINDDQKAKLGQKPGLEMVVKELQSILLTLSSEEPLSPGHHERKQTLPSPAPVIKDIKAPKRSSEKLPSTDRQERKRSPPPATKDVKVPPTPGPDQASTFDLPGSSTAPDPVDPVPPLSKVDEWINKGKGGKVFDYKEVTMAQGDENVANFFKNFLAGFPSGAPKSYYRSQLDAMVGGSGPNVLLVPYGYLRQYSSNLAMGICSHHKRLKKHLTSAARKFLVECFPNEVELANKLTLMFLELPKSHQKLELFINFITLLKPMKVFGEEQSVPKATPTSDACSMVQKILWKLTSNHMKGLSYAGDFGISDIEVFNGRSFIFCKSPQRFADPLELLRAAIKDFLRFAESILSKLSSKKFFVPFFVEFDKMLRNMGQFSSLYSDHKLVENVRDLVCHHPFLKSPVVTATFLCGVHSSCHSYDIGDVDAVFKKNLKQCGTKWVKKILHSKNSMLVEVLDFKAKKAEQSKKHFPEDGVLESEEYDALATEAKDFTNDLESLTEYFRHLFQHGSDKAKEKRRLLLRQDGSKLFMCEDGSPADPIRRPRRQYMNSMEETLLAAAARVGVDIVKIFYTLATTDSFKGMVLPFWEAYKNSSSSASNFLEDPMLDQSLLLQQKEEEEDA